MSPGGVNSGAARPQIHTGVCGFAPTSAVGSWGWDRRLGSEPKALSLGTVGPSGAPAGMGGSQWEGGGPRGAQLLKRGGTVAWRALRVVLGVC